MPEGLKSVFVMIGIIATVGMFCMILVSLFYWLKDIANDLRYNYKIKHRFDKKPVAKCYCRDCYEHSKTGQCCLPGSDRYTPDNGFCYEARPLKKNEAEFREKTGDTPAHMKQLEIYSAQKLRSDSE